MAIHHAAPVVKLDIGQGKPKKLQSPFSKNVTVVLIACVVISTRAAHTILCQPFKAVKVNNVQVPSAVYITLVEAISFPLSMLIWIGMSIYTQGHLHVPNGKYRMSMYALMGFLDAINSYCSAYGAVGLHVAIYTVLKASSIIFSVLFARLFTKKQFTNWHYLAVGTMFLASSLSIFSGQSDKKVKGEVGNFILAAIASFTSAASLGMLGVTTYKFVRHENQKSEMLCIAENNAFQALFMFVFLLPILAMPEIPQWPVLFEQFGKEFGSQSLVGISVALFISRPIMLFSSIAATSFASASMTRALGAPRRLIVVLFCLCAFRDREEPPNSWKWMTIAIMCTALMIYAYGGFVLQKMKKARQAKSLNAVKTETFTLLKRSLSAYF